MKTLSDVNVTGKVCLVRVDFNSPLNKNGEILDITRIKVHAETIKYIADHNGMVVVIAHQGRPGSSDFSSLKAHAEKLQYILGENYKIDFIAQTHGTEVETRIRKMKPKEILVLENVRMVDNETYDKSPEEHSKDPYIQGLASAADFFVNDAFSAAHRPHMSMVGFTPLLPSIAGLIMEREVKSLKQVVDNPQKPCTFILGGIKPDDSFKIIEYVLINNIANIVLTGGTLSQLFLLAKNKNLGQPAMDFLKHNDLLKFVGTAIKLNEQFKSRIYSQIDFAVEEGGRKIYTLDDLPLNGPILDIGDQTIEQYKNIIEKSATVVFNGPMGKFEDSQFKKGTLEIFKAMERSKGFSLAGGGHSVSVIEQNNIHLSYVSTAGKALLLFLMGTEFLAIDVLNK